MSMNDLLSEIDAYCAARRMSPTAFGRDAMSDPGFVARLRGGHECLPRTVRRARQYMSDNPVTAIVPDAPQSRGNAA